MSTPPPTRSPVTMVVAVKDGVDGGPALKINSDGSINAVATGAAGVPAPANITQVGGSTLALGSATSANSIPVVPASDYYPAAYTYSRKVADGQVKAGPGTLATLAISPTGSVVAGVLTIYDSLTETGTVLFSASLPVTTFQTIVIPLNVAFTTGLFVGFDATLTNVQVLAAYR